MASKINGTPKGAYLPISKLHSILAVANLLAHNNKSQICYCGQISLQVLQLTAVFLTISHHGGNIFFAGDVIDIIILLQSVIDIVFLLLIKHLNDNLRDILETMNSKTIQLNMECLSQNELLNTKTKPIHGVLH